MNHTKFSFQAFVLTFGLGVLFLLSTSGCKEIASAGKGGETKDGAAAKAQAGAPALRPVRAHVMNPVSRTVIDYEEFTGRIMPFDEVDVRSQVSGTLLTCTFKQGAHLNIDPQTGKALSEEKTAGEPELREGDEVKEGQLLFEIEPDVYQTILTSQQGELEVLEARRKRLEKIKDRAEKLRPSGAISDEEYDLAFFDLQECEAEIATKKANIEKAQIDVNYTKIYAPIDGYLCDSKVSVGNLIQDNSTSLVRIVKVDPIFIYINIDESTVQNLKKIAERRKAASPDAQVEQTIEFRLSDEKEYTHIGKVDYLTPTLEQGSGTRFIRAVCENPKTAGGDRTFQPGMTVHVRICVTEEYETLLVPDETIGTNQSVRYVYVLNEKNIPEMRTVELGPLQEDDMRVIRSGLEPTDRIVKDNLLRVRLDRPVEEIKD